jgi:hypothetical protein
MRSLSLIESYVEESKTSGGVSSVALAGVSREQFVIIVVL